MNGIPYYELTEQELGEHPIWVLAMDVVTYGGSDDDYDDDSGLVVPLPSDEAVVEQLFANCICYVRTSFVAANGRRFVGLMCADADGVESTQPAIVTDEGQVDFYLASVNSDVPDPAKIEADYARLGMTPDELFPLEFRPDVLVPGDGRSQGGVLNGFYYISGKRGSRTIECTQ